MKAVFLLAVWLIGMVAVITAPVLAIIFGFTGIELLSSDRSDALLIGGVCLVVISWWLS